VYNSDTHIFDASRLRSGRERERTANGAFRADRGRHETTQTTPRDAPRAAANRF